MSAGEVEAAIERIRQRDADLAQLTQAAADGLTAGEGTGMLDQAGVQEFLWAHVPTTFSSEDWHDVVAGAAVLLDELGLDRYAAIARSDQTAAILDAWLEGSAAGRKAFQTAHRASGVDPPNTNSLTWGDVYGPDEAQARDTVERALEHAIVVGHLVPGARGWKETASAITEKVLEEALELPPGQNLLSLVTTERAGTWLRTARAPELREWREVAVRRVLGPIDPPDGVEAVVAPMRWLIGHAAAGVELTQSGYVARALVIDAAQRFDWWRWDKPPRSEADLHQLADLREVASHLRLVRRSGRTLTATANGRRLLDDPEALWQVLAGSLGGSHAFDRTIGELVAHRLLAGPAVDDDLVVSIEPVVASLGWRTADGPLSRSAIMAAVWDRWRWWHILGLLERETAHWDRESQRRIGHDVTSLTTPGRATVLAFLRGVALKPRTDPYG
jgi:hypothetical protein